MFMKSMSFNHKNLIMLVERARKILDLITSKQLIEVMCYGTCSFVSKS